MDVRYATREMKEIGHDLHVLPPLRFSFFHLIFLMIFGLLSLHLLDYCARATTCLISLAIMVSSCGVLSS